MPALDCKLRITTDSKQGGRKYMEDCLQVKFENSIEGNGKSFYFLGVFDGHGGVHAAEFAKQHLLDEITKQKGFWSDEDNLVLKAIKDGFLSAHHKMWKIVGFWPKTLSGHPSTAGTTASVVFIRNGRLYVGHVGDSSVVIGKREDSLHSNLTAKLLTVDHKPESKKELSRIEENGGAVVAKAGVQRVVWNRPRIPHLGAVVRRSTPIDRIPFLAIARALGDLWSYNTERDVFIVSPEPDVSAYTLDVRETSCIVLASDGLWNMVRPQEAVDLVDYIHENHKNGCGLHVEPASELVRVALQRWSERCLRADNTSVIVAMVEPATIDEQCTSGCGDDVVMSAVLSPIDGAAATAGGRLLPLLTSDSDDCLLSDDDCNNDDIDMVTSEVGDEDSLCCHVTAGSGVADADVVNGDGGEEAADTYDDSNMSHQFYASPAPQQSHNTASTSSMLPKVMYPSAHVLKKLQQQQGCAKLPTRRHSGGAKSSVKTASTAAAATSSKSAAAASYPRVLIGNSERFNASTTTSSATSSAAAATTDISSNSSSKSRVLHHNSSASDDENTVTSSSDMRLFDTDDGDINDAENVIVVASTNDDATAAAASAKSARHVASSSGKKKQTTVTSSSSRAGSGGSYGPRRVKRLKSGGSSSSKSNKRRCRAAKTKAFVARNANRASPSTPSSSSATSSSTLQAASVKYDKTLRSRSGCGTAGRGAASQHRLSMADLRKRVMLSASRTIANIHVKVSGKRASAVKVASKVDSATTSAEILQSVTTSGHNLRVRVSPQKSADPAASSVSNTTTRMRKTSGQQQQQQQQQEVTTSDSVSGCTTVVNKKRANTKSNITTTAKTSAFNVQRWRTSTGGSGGGCTTRVVANGIDSNVIDGVLTTSKFSGSSMSSSSIPQQQNHSQRHVTSTPSTSAGACSNSGKKNHNQHRNQQQQLSSRHGATSSTASASKGVDALSDDGQSELGKKQNAHHHRHHHPYQPLSPKSTCSKSAPELRSALLSSSSSPLTPNRQKGSSSPKQGVSAKSPLRHHHPRAMSPTTSKTIVGKLLSADSSSSSADATDLSSMMSPMWPRCLEADDVTPLSGAGGGEMMDVASASSASTSSDVRRNFTALFSRRNGDVSVHQHAAAAAKATSCDVVDDGDSGSVQMTSPVTRACVKRKVQTVHVSANGAASAQATSCSATAHYSNVQNVKVKLNEIWGPKMSRTQTRRVSTSKK